MVAEKKPISRRLNSRKCFIQKHAIKFPDVGFALVLGLALSLRDNRARSACETVFSLKNFRLGATTSIFYPNQNYEERRYRLLQVVLQIQGNA